MRCTDESENVPAVFLAEEECQPYRPTRTHGEESDSSFFPEGVGRSFFTARIERARYIVHVLRARRTGLPTPSHYSEEARCAGKGDERASTPSAAHPKVLYRSNRSASIHSSPARPTPPPACPLKAADQALRSLPMRLQYATLPSSPSPRSGED